MTTPRCMVCGEPFPQHPTPTDVASTVLLEDYRRTPSLLLAHKTGCCSAGGADAYERWQGHYSFSYGGAWFDVHVAAESIDLRSFKKADRPLARQYRDWILTALKAPRRASPHGITFDLGHADRVGV